MSHCGRKMLLNAGPLHFLHTCPPKVGALGEALAILVGQALACMQKHLLP